MRRVHENSEQRGGTEMRRRSRYGWLELIEGILLILLGIITLFRPGNVLKGITIAYGIMAVITGISDIVFYAKTERYMGFGPTISLVSGILSILAGLMLLMYPNAGELVLVLLLPIWFIAHSISRLTHLSLVRMTAGDFYYYFTMILNIAGVILGFLMILWPSIALFSAGFIVGIYLILLGIDSIVMACSDMDIGWM